VEQEKVKDAVSKIQSLIKDYNYKEAEGLISDLLDEMIRGADNSYRPVYMGLLNEFKEAKDYRSDSNFTEEPLPQKYFYSHELRPILIFP
jgi:hypothetical protein